MYHHGYNEIHSSMSKLLSYFETCMYNVLCIWVNLGAGRKKNSLFLKHTLVRKRKRSTELWKTTFSCMGFPGGSVGKEPARDLVLILELERPSGEGSGNPLQYSFLGNPMDRGAWWGYDLWGHERQMRVDHHHQHLQLCYYCSNVWYRKCLLVWSNMQKPPG